MLCGAVQSYLSFPRGGECCHLELRLRWGRLFDLVVCCPPLQLQFPSVRLTPSLTLLRWGTNWGCQEAIFPEKVFASVGGDLVVNVQIRFWFAVFNCPTMLVGLSSALDLHINFSAWKHRAQEADALANWGHPAWEREKISHGLRNQSQQKTRNKARGRGNER